MGLQHTSVPECAHLSVRGRRGFSRRLTSLRAAVEAAVSPARSSERKGSKSKAAVATERLQWHPRRLSLNPTSVGLFEESWAHRFSLSRVKMNALWKTEPGFTCLRSNTETDKNL